MRNTGSKPKGSSASDTNRIAPKLDVTAPSSANNYVSTFSQATLKNGLKKSRMRGTKQRKQAVASIPYPIWIDGHGFDS